MVDCVGEGISRWKQSIISLSLLLGSLDLAISMYLEISGQIMAYRERYKLSKKTADRKLQQLSYEEYTETDGWVRQRMNCPRKEGGDAL